MEVNKTEAASQPTIAIMTMHDQHRPFRGNHFNFIDLIRTGKEMGAKVYVVTARDVQLSNRTIKSFVYNADTKTWTKKPLPLPQVIYNRIPSRRDEQLPEVQQTIAACLKHTKLRIFNPNFFNKWTLYEWLGNAKATKKYIPATCKFAEFQDLEAMLQQYSCVYLKPVLGKAGKGIMKIDFEGFKSSLPYLLYIQNKKKSNLTRYGRMHVLWSKLKQQIGDEDYIIQQGITSASYKQRPFDLRVLVQKNNKGRWSLTGIGARVAGNLSITTHVPRGGSIDEPEKLLNLTFGTENGKHILYQVRQSALTIARQIEKASGHNMGEMSLDLGIDTAGQIWFFEANSRPMKFDEPDIRKKSLEQIIKYCEYLSQSRKKK